MAESVDVNGTAGRKPGRLTEAALLLAATTTALAGSPAPAGQVLDQVTIRGRVQTVRIYGTRGGDPVLVSSGDGGWLHLGPDVARFLESRGYFVVGVDAKAYLTSFTEGRSTLTEDEVRVDYRAFVEYAARGSRAKPVLIGVSEGAGLSVLAATDLETRHAIAGVIGLGLPDVSELGWRWRDSLIYLTHGTPNEPGFRVDQLVAALAPLPLAAIHSTHDEYVPLAEVQRVIARARDPKRLWIVEARNHRFSGNETEFQQRLLEALDWVKRLGGAGTPGG